MHSTSHPSLLKESFRARVVSRDRRKLSNAQVERGKSEKFRLSIHVIAEWITERCRLSLSLPLRSCVRSPKPKRCGGGAADIIAANYRAARPLDLSVARPMPLSHLSPIRPSGVRIPVLHTRNGGRFRERKVKEVFLRDCRSRNSHAETGGRRSDTS